MHKLSANNKYKHNYHPDNNSFSRLSFKYIRKQIIGCMKLQLAIKL